MPIYEYRCNHCRRRITIFLRGFADPLDLVCTHCRSRDVVRLVSRFAVIKSEESRLEDMADPTKLGDLDENDPRSIARWAKRMGKELGEDMGPEFDEIVERMEAGEMPEDFAGAAGGLDNDLEQDEAI